MNIYVKTANGSPANYAKVGYAVCESFSCIGGQDFRTDKNGYVRLEWSTNCNICIIYINGKAHKGTYNEDGYYSFIAE